MITHDKAVLIVGGVLIIGNLMVLAFFVWWNGRA